MLYIILALAFLAVAIVLGTLNWFGVAPGAGGAVTLAFVLALASLGAAYLPHHHHRHQRRHAHS